MYVLGIETSCDETAAAVVKDGRQVLSSEVASSLKFHKKYGGIVPEIAFRMQLETIAEVADSAVRDAGIKLKQVGLVSVTQGPGLLGSLLTGISFAKALSLSLDIPIIGVNHLYSHLYANFLDKKHPVRFPFLGLIVSGGHTSLLYIRDFDRIEIVGQTYDDACGEAFDKVAKILKLGYPGGPLVEKAAKGGSCAKIRFGCSATKAPFDFSFSGIKTAVLYYTHPLAPKSQVASRKPQVKTADIAASFQEAVIGALVRKSLAACKAKNARRLVIGGGVIANNMLRQRFLEEAGRQKIAVYFPPREFCLDNAAMVAGFGWALFKKGHASDLYLNAQPN